MNGITKSKLTIASARQLKEADEGTDVKKLSAATMVNENVVSPAAECKRWLELEGKQHSVRKSQKRESNRKFQKMHNFVRGLDEKLSGLKYCAPVLPKGLKSKDMYHIYACPELGLQNIAMRQIPCFCNATRSNACFCYATLSNPCFYSIESIVLFS